MQAPMYIVTKPHISKQSRSEIQQHQKSLQQVRPSFDLKLFEKKTIE